MTDNPESVRQIIQDFLTPEVRDLKARLTALEREMLVRFEAMNQRLTLMDQKIEQRFTALDQKIDFQLQTILSAISEAKARGELSGIKAIVSIAERVAVLEAKSK